MVSPRLSWHCNLCHLHRLNGHPCLRFSPQVGGRVAVSKTVYSTKESVRMLHRRSSDFFLRSEITGKQGNIDNTSALTHTSSCHKRRISGKGPSAVPNAAISASSFPTTATVHAAVDCEGIYRLSCWSLLF